MAKRRSGITLLELILATTLMTAIVVTVAVVLRTGHMAWEAHQGDMAQVRAANATVRHIVRRVRQAQAVTAISDPSDSSGNLAVQMPSGETLVWGHNSSTQEVAFGVGSADHVLGKGILELSFIGYEADATTQTTNPADIRSVRCQVLVELPRETGGTRPAGCWAWLRSW